MSSPTNQDETADPGRHPAHPRPPIDRDVLCAACGYNLRGLTSDRCPECGTHIPEPGQPITLAQFLRGRDLYCKYCKYNLRDLEGDTCPECGTRYYLAGGTGRTDSRPAPMKPGEFAAGCLMMADTNPSAGPQPRPPIDRDAPCPECGYSLRGLVAERCPECGWVVNMAELEDAPLPRTELISLGSAGLVLYNIVSITAGLLSVLASLDLGGVAIFVGLVLIGLPIAALWTWERKKRWLIGLSVPAQAGFAIACWSWLMVLCLLMPSRAWP